MNRFEKLAPVLRGLMDELMEHAPNITIGDGKDVLQSLRDSIVVVQHEESLNDDLPLTRVTHADNDEEEPAKGPQLVN